MAHIHKPPTGTTRTGKLAVTPGMMAREFADFLRNPLTQPHIFKFRKDPVAKMGDTSPREEFAHAHKIVKRMKEQLEAKGYKARQYPRCASMGSLIDRLFPEDATDDDASADNKDDNDDNDKKESDDDFMRNYFRKQGEDAVDKLNCMLLQWNPKGLDIDDDDYDNLVDILSEPPYAAVMMRKGRSVRLPGLVSKGAQDAATAKPVVVLNCSAVATNEDVQKAFAQWTDTLSNELRVVPTQQAALTAAEAEYLEQASQVFIVRDASKKELPGLSGTIARADFPLPPSLDGEPNQSLVINPKQFDTFYNKVGALGHEVGHLLGLVHEEQNRMLLTLLEKQQHDKQQPGTPVPPDPEPLPAVVPLTEYDPKSIMLYEVLYRDNDANKVTKLSEADKRGCSKLYGDDHPQYRPTEVKPKQPEKVVLRLVEECLRDPLLHPDYPLHGDARRRHLQALRKALVALYDKDVSVLDTLKVHYKHSMLRVKALKKCLDCQTTDEAVATRLEAFKKSAMKSLTELQKVTPTEHKLRGDTAKPCPCLFEDLKAAKASGPLLDENFLCRACHMLAAYHKRTAASGHSSGIVPMETDDSKQE